MRDLSCPPDRSAIRYDDSSLRIDPLAASKDEKSLYSEMIFGQNHEKSTFEMDAVNDAQKSTFQLKGSCIVRCHLCCRISMLTASSTLANNLAAKGTTASQK